MCFKTEDEHMMHFAGMYGSGMMNWMWFFWFVWAGISVAVFIVLILLIIWLYKKLLKAK